MDFRRIHDLPPYVFATVDQLKRELRRDGRDVIDLGFGNPDIPSPQIAVEKLAEAAARPNNHRYSSSRGLPNLRQALCERYEKVFGVQLDPDLNVVSTIGAKEGLSHLMWVLLEPGDSAVVSSPPTRFISWHRAWPARRSSTPASRTATCSPGSKRRSKRPCPPRA